MSAGQVAEAADDPDFDAWLDAVAAAGVEAVQIREKHLDDRPLFELVCRARRRLPAATLLLVNARADIALAAGANGIHLPASGLPVAALRRRWGGRLWIGRSTHTVEEVRAAHDDGADYVTFGPVYATPSKAAYGPPPGLDELQRATALRIPVLALGGVNADRLTEVAAAGAQGAAGIRAFHRPEGLPELVRRAREVFTRDTRAEDRR